MTSYLKHQSLNHLSLQHLWLISAAAASSSGLLLQEGKHLSSVLVALWIVAECQSHDWDAAEEEALLNISFSSPAGGRREEEEVANGHSGTQKSEKFKQDLGTNFAQKSDFSKEFRKRKRAKNIPRRSF